MILSFSLLTDVYALTKTTVAEKSVYGTNDDNYWILNINTGDLKSSIRFRFKCDSAYNTYTSLIQEGCGYGGGTPRNIYISIVSGTNNHDLTLLTPTVKTQYNAGSKSKEGAQDVIEFQVRFKLPAHYTAADIVQDNAYNVWNDPCSFDETTGAEKSNTFTSTGTHSSSDRYVTMSITLNLQTTGMAAWRDSSAYTRKYRYTNQSLTLNYDKEETYTVSYDANGGSDAPEAQMNYNCTNTVLSSSKPTRTGYTFNGWNTKADGTGTDYNPSSVYSLKSSVTLYAQWELANDRNIEINMKIKKSDINFSNGDPCFIVKCEGYDLSNNFHCYYQICSIREDMEADAEGYVIVQCLFENIPSGYYNVSDISTMRYVISNIENTVGGTVKGKTVEFDMCNNVNAKSTFVYENIQSEYFSDNDYINNSF